MSLDNRIGGVNWRAAENTSTFGGVAKRTADLAVALPALMLLSPVMLFIALAVKIHDGGPVFFSQERVGRQGRLFRCIKFRSMVVGAEDCIDDLLSEDAAAAEEWREKQKLAHDPRVTAVGRILRITSADELPQLINVVRGEMSVVGPRPITPDQIDEYGAGFGRYCTARPGITGLWQVSGRNETTFRRRSEFDQTYLAAWSLLTDFVLLLRTVEVVVRHRGAC
jgi:lipopolysaccharide/colanic/teichoic acid biosynthesis glycosyltransferase